MTDFRLTNTEMEEIRRATETIDEFRKSHGNSVPVLAISVPISAWITISTTVQVAKDRANDEVYGKKLFSMLPVIRDAGNYPNRWDALSDDAKAGYAIAARKFRAKIRDEQ